jgi:hypothetical protein
VVLLVNRANWTQSWWAGSIRVCSPRTKPSGFLGLASEARQVHSHRGARGMKQLQQWRVGACAQSGWVPSCCAIGRTSS